MTDLYRRRVQRQTEDYLDEWWAERFSVARTALWRSFTTMPHGTLGDYPGYFVAWRGDGVHVSLPTTADPDAVNALGQQAIATLQEPSFWRGFAESIGLSLIGPSTHAYLDRDPGTDARVEPVDASVLASLEERVPEEDWRESGFADAPPLAFGLHEDGVLVAASNLHLFGDRPRDVGVLVAPEGRGRGLAAVVARRAASHAVREHGLARWGARNTNVASLATARRLGFEPWCTQLAIRQPS